MTVNYSHNFQSSSLTPEWSWFLFIFDFHFLNLKCSDIWISSLKIDTTRNSAGSHRWSQHIGDRDRKPANSRIAFSTYWDSQNPKRWGCSPVVEDLPSTSKSSSFDSTFRKIDPIINFREHVWSHSMAITNSFPLTIAFDSIN